MEEDNKDLNIVSIKWIKKFLLMNYYLFTYDVKGYKQLTKDINYSSFFILYFLFNVGLLTAFNSVVPQLFNDVEIKEIRLLFGVYEKNNFEYFISFVIGYVSLFFVIKYIFDKIVDDCENSNDIILHALLGVSGILILFRLLNNLFYVIMDYLLFKTGELFTEVGWIYISVLWLVWLTYIYQLLEFNNKKDKCVVVFGIIVALIIKVGSIFLFDTLQIYNQRDCIFKDIKLQKVAEKSFVEAHYNYDIKISDRERYSNVRKVNDKEALDDVVEIKRGKIKTESNMFFTQGIALARMNDISYCLYAHRELSYKERYKYALIYVLTTMLIEEPRNGNVLDSIVNVIEGDYGYGLFCIKNNNQILMKPRYNNLTFSEVETARVAICDLDDLEKYYKKEINRNVDYRLFLADTCAVGNKLECYKVELIEDNLEKFSAFYFVTHLIRFIPLF